MLRVKEWRNKQNTQFEFLFEDEKENFVKRHEDNLIFCLGTRFCLGAADSIKILKFHEDLIHVTIMTGDPKKETDLKATIQINHLHSKYSC